MRTRWRHWLKRGISASGPLPRGRFTGRIFFLLALLLQFQFLFLFLLPEPGKAAEGQFVARAWTAVDGLPSNDINDLAQSADGYLWIGTSRGLCRYDGFRFVSCGPEEGMGSVDVQRMVSDPRGQIWLQDDDRNIRVRRGKVFQAGPVGMSVDQTAADGSIWGLGLSAFTRYAEGKLTEIPLPPGWPKVDVIKFLATRDHGLLALSWKGEILSWRDGTWSPWRDFRSGGETNEAGALFEDSTGAVWLSIEPDKVWRVTETEKTKHILPGNKNGFWQMAERQPGEIWATATDGGIWHLEDGEFRRFPMPADTMATRMLVDKAGTLWLATTGSGLLRIDRAKVHPRKLDDLAGGGRISALAELEPGAFVVGTVRNGTWQWQDGKASPWPPGDPQFQDYIYCNAMLKARDGTLWIGTNFALHAFRDGRRLAVPGLDKMIEPGDSAMSLWECRDGSLLVGAGVGRLSRVRDGHFQHIPVPGCQSSICDISEGPDGALWVASKWDGIFRVKDGEVRHFGEAEGLPGRRSFSLFYDRQGRLWAGFGTGGLFGFREGRFIPVPLRGEGAANSVLQMAEDNHGWLWFCGDQGISGLSLNEAVTSMNGGRAAGTVHAGLAEGMASEQCQAMKPLVSDGGMISFGTIRGFVSFLPRELKEHPSPASPLLEEIYINENPSPVSAGDPPVEVPPEARFEVHFTGIDLRHGDGLRFRCRLNGFEPEWNETGTRRFAGYTKVPPGEYDFEVSSRNSSGWNPVPAHLRIRVQPHFWQELWFQILCALAAAGGVALAARGWEQARARRKAAALARVNGERTRIALDLHDGIGSGLTQVGMMAAALQKELSVAGQAGESSKLLQQRIRSLAQDLDIAVWATSPRHDNVAALCTYLSEYLIEYFRNSGIRCWIRVPENPGDTPIGPEVRHHLFMAAREAMNNCLKHSGATEIRLSIARTDGWLTIILADNGTGFSPDQAAQRHRNGLKNLTERMGAAGGLATVESGPGGTSVTFSLQLPGGSV